MGGDGIRLSMEMVFTIAVNVAVVAMAFSRQAEQIKTLFFQLGDVKQKHDTHVDKLDNLVSRVSDLCARFDMMMAMSQHEPGQFPAFPGRVRGQ